ncbi:MAG: putative rane protein [Deltaproteobacteria bacterium]|nr:putative rane protein [Deltaproteobacteria bacterium]
MRPRFSPLALGLAGLFLLAGCAHLFGRAEAPKVNIANITPKEMKLFEQVFSMDLRVMNPTDKEIAIKGVVFDLEVNGQPFARGVSNQAITVAPFASQVLPVEAVTTLASLLRQIVQAQKEELTGFTYRLSGFFQTDSSAFRIPFDETGEFKRSP